MKKIGIIIDKYHLKYKVSEFLKYLNSKADVEIYTEETFLLDSSRNNFDEDLFFVKGKGDLILAFIKLIENETNIPVINSYRGTWLAINRFLNSVVLRKIGIPIPDFSLNPKGSIPPFRDYIIKNIIDQKNYKFKPIVHKENGRLKVADERALNEVDKVDPRYNYLYYQKFIKSKWEYKLYGIGDKVYFYKQIPILINPNKIESRREIDKEPELEEYCFKAMEEMDLKLASLDFLKSKGQFFLTDINCTPNFNYIKSGHVIVA
ncbi:MAG: RimK family alpha-L-glutamate ligase, partial [Candidatus Thorarchaeota archaeon]